MKWVLIAAAVVIGLVALVVIVGFLLPKAHQASRKVRLRQPAATVWRTITEIDAMPSWRSDVTSVERMPDRDGHAVYVEVGKNGRLPLEVVERQEPRRLVTKIADPSLPFGGTWTFEITPENDSCDITITERGEVYNPIFRFVSRLFMDPAATLEAYLTSLGRKFGETPDIRVGS
jgi:uncharacterized membrane protein